MLAAGSMAMEAPNVLVELSRLAKGHVPLILLVNDGLELDNVVSILGVNDNNTTSSHRFAYVPHNTMWARDYGPIVLADRLSSPSIVVDAAYNDLGRDSDGAVPSTIAEMSNVATRHTTLCIPGGNLLSNGRGLCVTTTKVQEENAGTAQYEIADSIARSYGATTVAILEPLKDEPTGHVDMFATFTDANTVVVGRYSPSVDPINAEILDRNAERLASIRLGSERLRVVRIGMPPRADNQWHTFTNVVYANGLLLVPKYESSTEYQLQSVRKVYSRLLPDWQVQFVSADDLICNGGALHCVVSNLGTLQTHGTVERAVARSISSRFRVASWYSKTN